METLKEFVERLKKEIPCYYHQRVKGNFSLTKYDTSSREMGLFAVVTELKYKFRIMGKEWLANDECKKWGKLGWWDHGTNRDGTKRHGLIFYVNKGSKGQDKDYNDAVRCLKVILKNLDC